jgi:GxxExxY protein
MAELVLKEESYKIIGACMEVYNTLGSGFLESVYQEALETEFQQRGIPYAVEKPISIFYKGQVMRKRFIADFVCYDQVILELKAIESLTNENGAQVLNYLKATNLALGLLVNFGASSFQYKRYANTKR